MDNDKIKALLLYFMDYFQRRRTLLQRQLMNSHTALLKTLAAQRRNTAKRILALNNDLAARFVIENAHFVRFREHKQLKRSEKYWQIMQAPGNETLFFQNFRMSKNTFEQLCEKLAPRLKTTQTVLLTIPLTVEKQLAICLYKLVTGCTYKEVGETFGVSKSTVHKYFRATIEAIVALKDEFIKFPDSKEALNMAKHFKKITELPNLFGVIDCFHIPILPPERKSENFMNSEGWASVALQAVVDHEHLFRHACISSGSVNNIFTETNFLENDAYPNSRISTPTHGEFPLMLIGNSSYPLHAHILKPYLENLQDLEANFNSHIEFGLSVAQHAFKRLKGRWQYLSQKIEINPDFVPSVVLACCILHNYLEVQKVAFLDAWLADAMETGCIFTQPIKTDCYDIIADSNHDPYLLRERLNRYLNSC